MSGEFSEEDFDEWDEICELDKEKKMKVITVKKSNGLFPLYEVDSSCNKVCPETEWVENGMQTGKKEMFQSNHRVWVSDWTKQV